ncbi:MAG TPA: CBS domain-containing protein [Propylenella sp.]
MQISEIMTRDVKLIHPGDSIRDAARRMRDEDFGSLPVAEGDRLVGFVTDRDIVIRGLANSGGPDSPVRDVMSDHVLYCFEDETVESVATNMARNQVRRLPVLTREKRLCGIVALGDIATHGADEPAEEALEGISRPTH